MVHGDALLLIRAIVSALEDSFGSRPGNVAWTDRDDVEFERPFPKETAHEDALDGSSPGNDLRAVLPAPNAPTRPNISPGTGRRRSDLRLRGNSTIVWRTMVAGLPTCLDTMRGRSALIIGHPGHELRVWGWMRATRPVVAILTDGSGRGSEGRLGLSREACRQASATISRHFGMTSDADVYRAILNRDTAFFLNMAHLLATLLVEREIDWVAGDAMEGYNPTHDLCHLLINRAVRLTASTRTIATYTFDLVGAESQPPPDAHVVEIDLPPKDLALKVDEARKYATSAGGTLLGEVESLLRGKNTAAFARERLVATDVWREIEPPPDYRPFYEIYGEQQVAAGRYAFPIRFREHLWPIACALQE